MYTKALLRLTVFTAVTIGVCAAPSAFAKKGGNSGGDGGGGGGENARFTIVELDMLFPQAISDSSLGDVWIVGLQPDPARTSAYVWRQNASGQVTSGFLPEPELVRPDGSVYNAGSEANGVNEFGDVVGAGVVNVGWWTEQGEPRDYGSNALLWTRDNQGQFHVQNLDPLDSFGSSGARGVNNSQTVVGTFNRGAGTMAFVWHASTGMVDLNDLLGADDATSWLLTHAQSINDDGVVVGHGFLHGNVRGFVMDLATGAILTVPLITGAINNACVGINEDGDVSGTAWMADGSTRAFAWRGASLIDLGNMGADGAVGLDLNEQSHVVGESTILNGRSVATLWETDGQAWTGVALETEIPPPGRKEPTWELKFAWSINADGWIVGEGQKVGRWQITPAGFLLAPNAP